MKLVNQLQAKLATVGATAENDGYTLHCDAPSGYVWRANGGTCIAIPYANNSQSWLASALREDGYKRLSMGLVKVVDQERLKSIRFELGDDSWGAPDGAPDRIDFCKAVAA